MVHVEFQLGLLLLSYSGGGVPSSAIYGMRQYGYFDLLKRRNGYKNLARKLSID